MQPNKPIYNPDTVLKIFNEYMSSKGSVFVSKPNWQGFAITCPGQHFHQSKTKEHDCLVQPKLVNNGFHYIRIICNHRHRCFDSRVEFSKELNRDWGKYLEQHYTHDGHSSEGSVCNASLIHSSLAKIKEDNERKEREEIEREKKKVKFREFIFSQFDSLKIDTEPAPVFLNQFEDFRHFKRLWKPDEIIFIGNRYNCQTVKMSEYRYNYDDEFTCGNVFREAKTKGKNTENTLFHKYQIIENDSFDLLTQYKILMTFKSLGMPLVMVVHSGGKSLHGWFKYSTKEQMEKFKNTICDNSLKTSDGLKFDPAIFRTMQVIRCPGMYRVDKQRFQRIVFFDESEISG